MPHVIGAFFAATLAFSPIGECDLPKEYQGERICGLSGITHVANDDYYAVSDRGARLYSLRIGIDRETGMATNCTVNGVAHLEGRGDLEGVAWDARRNLVWVSDEKDATITAFGKNGGACVDSVAVPEVFKKFRFNYSLESLSVGSGASVMWTCNEEALACDGELASDRRGSRIRLQRFVRRGATSAWHADGEWRYVTDRIGGTIIPSVSRSGVADLLCMEDGSLFALEREFSIKKGRLLPSFRCRIYNVIFGEGKEVRKKRVFSADTGMTMYEGICAGPRLNDGSRVILLISDGNDTLPGRIFLLNLVLGS